MTKHKAHLRQWLSRSRESVQYFEQKLAGLDPHECPVTLSGRHDWRDQDTRENRVWISVPAFCVFCNAKKEVSESESELEQSTT